MIPVKISLEKGAELPTYQSQGAAGVDLCTRESFILHPMERRLVQTGIRVAIPTGFEGQIRARSGLALKHGIALVNSPGTIDSDYRGEIGAILINFGDSDVQFDKGDRIAQLIVCPVARASWQRVENLEESLRGEGGFGSTGR